MKEDQAAGIVTSPTGGGGTSTPAAGAGGPSDKADDGKAKMMDSERTNMRNSVESTPLHMFLACFLIRIFTSFAYGTSIVLPFRLSYVAGTNIIAQAVVSRVTTKLCERVSCCHVNILKPGVFL